MKLNRTAAAVAALIVALVMAAGATAAVVHVGPAKNGKSISLQRGDRLVVSLAGNATTGYAWKLQSVDRKILRPILDTYVPSPHPAGIVGSGGVYRLGFRALAKGTTTLRLVYARSSGAPARKYLLHVAVG